MRQRAPARSTITQMHCENCSPGKFGAAPAFHSNCLPRKHPQVTGVSHSCRCAVALTCLGNLCAHAYRKKDAERVWHRLRASASLKRASSGKFGVLSRVKRVDSQPSASCRDTGLLGTLRQLQATGAVAQSTTSKRHAKLHAACQCFGACVLARTALALRVPLCLTCCMRCLI